MITPSSLDDLVNRVMENLPAGAMALREDLKKNMRTALQATLKQMHLVTQEEFEVQRAVLEKTRAQLHALQTQVAQLERHVNMKHAGDVHT